MSVRRAVCPGSFDPPTNGHADIFARASKLFDEVVIAIGVNPAKAASPGRLFTSDERLEMLREAVEPFGNVTVTGFTGLLAEFCRGVGAVALVKGVRGVTDYEYEAPMAGMNRHLVGVETVFLPTDPRWGFVSSSLVKEVASLGGDVSALVSPPVHERLLARLAERTKP